MTGKVNTDFLGRKVFFLYPSVFIQNKVINALAQKEFEVYSVRDENKLRKVLKKYPNSIVFVNISEGLLEHEWENWIKSVMADSATAGVDIGVIAYGENAAIRQKYTEKLEVSCDYTVMKPDLSAVVKQLAGILNKANAKDRRKYVRVFIGKGTNNIATIPINGNFISGDIIDISMAGFSCFLAEDPDLTRNSHFTNIQLQLGNQTLKVQGMFFASRLKGAEKVYIFLFTQYIALEVQTEIRKFISSLLQQRIDKELEK